MSAQPLFDAAGRPRSPATLPGYHAGRPPRNKGQRYPADPPTVDEIVAVMRRAGDGRHGRRMRGLIVVLWRAGLRIHEALALDETDLDERRGSVLVRHGKDDRRREVGMNSWGLVGPPRLGPRSDLACARAAVLRDRRTDPRARLVRQCGPGRAAPPGRSGWGAATVRAAPAAARACGRVAARGDPAAADPAPARTRLPVDHWHLPAGHLHRGDHRRRSRPQGTHDGGQQAVLERRKWLDVGLEQLRGLLCGQDFVGIELDQLVFGFVVLPDVLAD